MARYVSLIRFTDQGVRAINKSAVRAAAFQKAAKSNGVTVEAQFWTVGAYDGVLIINADDPKKALRSLSALNKAGFVRTETMSALDAPELNEITGK